MIGFRDGKPVPYDPPCNAPMFPETFPLSIPSTVAKWQPLCYNIPIIPQKPTPFGVQKGYIRS